MRKSLEFAFVFVPLALALAACGGDDSSMVVQHPPPDASVAVPDAATCDPLTQDCTNAKCSLDLTMTDTTSTWGATCRAVTGSVAIGAHCQRQAEGAAGVGKDDCAVGGYCTAIGDLSGDTTDAARVCRTFCNANSSCAKGQICFALTAMLVPHDVGICTNGCTILGTGTCTNGTWCSFTNTMDHTAGGNCIKPGTAAIDATCSATVACVQGSICITTTPAGGGTPTNACKEICDVVAGDAGAMHACPTGQTCRALTSGPTDWGICTPMM